MEAEQVRFIREEIKRQMNVVLTGEAGPSDVQTETINNLFPGMPGISNKPVMHPFGLVSRAAQGITSVVVRIGDHFGSRMTIGHRDRNKPTDVDEGETIVYSVGDYRVKVSKTQILVGKGTDYEPVLVGETTRQFLISLVQLVISHTHLGNLGVETGPPLNSTDFTQLQSQNLDNKKVLAEDGGRYT